MCVAAALLLAWASWDTRVSGLAMVVPGPIIASGSAFLVAPMPSLEQTRKLVSWILLLLVGFSHPIWCPGLFVVTSELMQPGSMGGVLWIVASAAPYLVLCTFLAGARIALAVFTGGALLGAMALGAGDRFQGLNGALLLLASATSLLLGCLRERRRDPAWFLARSLCPHCLYSLVGNTSGICPECGTPIPPR